MNYSINITKDSLNQISRELIYSIYKKDVNFGKLKESFTEVTPPSTIEIFFTEEDKIKELVIPENIELSENNCTFIFKKTENIFDILGVYQNQNPNSEGKIILYKKCIEEFGEYFYTENPNLPLYNSLSNIECIKLSTEMTYKIVLWHELGHWITHWMNDSNGKNWDDRFWTLTPNPNDLLEGLAQLITYYAIINDPEVDNLKYLFEYMLLGQSIPYKKHIDIIKEDNFNWVNCLKSIEIIRTEFTQDFSNYIRILNSLKK